MPPSSPFVDLVRTLREQRRSERSATPISCSAFSGWDRLLPDGKICGGGLVEWLCDSAGGGRSLAMLMASQVLRARPQSMLVVIDAEREFFPVTLPSWGIPLERLTLVHPRTSHELLWTWEQVLRCPGVGACLGAMPDVPPVALRRLQLAAEQGGGLGFLVRPLQAARQPGWAHIRWRVTPLAATRGRPPSSPAGRHFRVELLRCREHFSGGVADVEFTHEANALPVVSVMADSAVPLRATGS